MRPHPEPESSPRRALRHPWLPAIGRLVVALGFAIADAAGAAEPAGDVDRWVPSLSFSFEIARQKADGTVTTGPIRGAPFEPFDDAQDAFAPGNGCLMIDRRFTPPHFSRTGAVCPTVRLDPTKLDRDDAGSNTSVAPMVGASLELMAPRLLHGWLDPRLFAHGDGALAWGFERNLAGRGSPGNFTVPPVAQAASDVEELSIPGQGSRARWQLDRFVYSAGAGIAFTFKIFERTFRLKPSFEWIEVEQDFIGVTRREVKLDAPVLPGNLTGLHDFRAISLNRVKTRTFDGIGPGLEIEVDTARLGPIQTSIFATGRGYHLFGNLDTTLTATNQFGETATWSFSPEQWIVRAGVGIRFRWVPEAE
jgi:hypothetical protein